MQKCDTNLADIAYQELLKKIVTLEIRPGAFLQERTLAEQLSMSRTPVREALNRLAQESWVKINARRNIEVKGLYESDVRNLFAARETLELRGIDTIIDTKRTHEAVLSMKAALERMERSSMNGYEFNKADIEFHETMSLADNNRYFTEFWKRIILENARMGLVAFAFFEHNTRKVCMEHTRIVEGIEKSSKKIAKAALVAHLEAIKNAILASMKLKDLESLEDSTNQAIYAARSRGPVE